MAVTKKPWGVLMTAATDSFTTGTSGAQIYVKYVAFETADASADGQFDLLDAAAGVNIVPQYDYVDADRTPPAQFAIENFVGQTIYLNALPTGGRVFVYFGRRP